MRSWATTRRGSSSSRKPTARNGKARIEKSAIACTELARGERRLDTRQAPSQSTITVPRLGRASRPRLEAGVVAVRPRGGAQVRRRRVAAGGLAVLEAEGLDDEHALEALVGDAGHLAGAGLGAGGGPSTPGCRRCSVEA